ncbi:MAG: DUF2752 domain-containing protein [Muribaculaceae bacterium]|nr:DUF2752 domain-containing protein [Muribaculaceae bacterium]
MMRRALIIVVIVVAAVLAVTIYFNFDPSESRFFPKCFFFQFTGYKCPGCGSQRAIHAMLHGDIATAWHFNAAMLLLLPLLVTLLIAEVKRKSWPRFYGFLNSMSMIWLVLVLLVLWGVLRNVFGV